MTMNTLNLKASMKTQSHFSPAVSAPNRSADSLARRPLPIPPSGVAVLLAVLLSWLWPGQCAADALTDTVNKRLYYASADDTPGFEKNRAAFRYKNLLYGMETNSALGTNSLRARFETMANLYGDLERIRARAAETDLLAGLALAPSDPDYGHLLLDLYYDRAAAEAILARNLLEEASKAHYGGTVGVSPDLTGFIIDKEIPLYTNALAASRWAVSNYFALFALTNMITNESGAPATDYPGMRFFQNLVAARGLAPATCTNGTGLVSVTGDDTPLFSGFKDLVFANGLLRDYARVAETLARLHFARGTSGDWSAAKALVTDAQRFVYLHGCLLGGLFPGLDPATTEPASGLVESQAGWEIALTGLDALRQFLDGQANLLGFAPDFLLLIGKQSTNFDSFDSFRSLLQTGNPDSELQNAKEALAIARNSYASYRGFEGQLQDAFDEVAGATADRLAQIVGQYPYPNGDDTPLLGSEAWQQQNLIEIAQLQIQRNRAEIANLKQEIQIEVDRRGEEQGINNAIASVQIEYGNKQASITEDIGHIEAAQKLADAAAEAAGADWTSPWSAGADVANGIAQAVAEEMKGQLQADKERLAAQQEAKITSLNDQLLDVNSKALIKNLWLQMNTLAIDSQQAALQLKQEQGRLVALAREKASLESTLAESDSALTARYFADPAHRLNSQYHLVQADLCFAEAQKWLFFMARALEYKWNRPFTNYTYLNRPWSTATLFKLRNADELDNCYQAMAAFDGTFNLPSRSDDRFDWFSVRENFFGYRRYDTTGAPLMYVDPPTGQSVTAVEAFRRRLQRLADSDPQGKIRLQFNTVREIKGTTFFQGPDYLPDGSVDPSLKGLYLDKIIWMKIRLPGYHSTTNVPQTANKITGSLAYGGTSYLRNRVPGVRDLIRTDRIVGEMTPHSTRFWRPDDYDPNRWVADENQIEQINMLKASSSVPRLDGSPDQIDVLPSVQQIDVFAERSVAATGWELVIPTGADLLYVSELDDIEIYFYHWAFSRN